MKIVTRAEAGLANPKKPLSPASRQRALLFLHHSVTRVTPDPRADWRRVQAAAFSRGFGDISYTWGVHPNGTVLEGRSPATAGAHTEGYNSTAHAICLIGNYDTEYHPTDAVIAAVQNLRVHLVNAGFLTSAHDFRYHRQVKATDCPGKRAIARFADFAAKPPAPAEPSAPPRLIESTEIDMVINSYSLGIITDENGNGWQKVPYKRARIVGHTPPGLRPAADNRYLVGQVGFAEEGDGTIVSVTEWQPKTAAVIEIHVVN